MISADNYIIKTKEEIAEKFQQNNSREQELDQAAKLAEEIVRSNKINSLRDLIRVRDQNSQLQNALKVIERNKDLYLKKNLLLHYVYNRPSKDPVRVAVTGASGAIGYALLFRIASGEMLGKDQPVHLSLLELPVAMKSLQGVIMELKDCAFPLLSGVTASSSPDEAFEGANYALLVGAQPRTKGMERGDLLKANGAIFSVQGKALNDRAARDVKVLVVGNPANTNAYIAANNAPKLDPKNFTAMTRLDHNRGLAQLAEKTGKPVTSIKRFVIWGNHSATQYPDISHTQIEEKWARELVPKEWVEKEFIPTVQQRGAAIINARGSSSAASAASSAIDHIRDWVHGTNGEWTSMAVHSDGSYGVTPGLYFSYPVVTQESNYSIVQNVPIDEFSAKRLEITHKELLSERDAVKDMIKK